MITSVMLGIGQTELEIRAEDQRRGIKAAKKRVVYTGRQRGTREASQKRVKELESRVITVKKITPKPWHIRKYCLAVFEKEGI